MARCLTQAAQNRHIISFPDGKGQLPTHLLTTVILLICFTIIIARLRAGKDQPHYSEYRDFALIRHARHGPLLLPKRTVCGELEVVSFGLHYILSARPVPAWWPVVTPKDAENMQVYRHAVYLCVLPCECPPFQLWSRSHRWEVGAADNIVRGQPRDLTPEFNEHFDLIGSGNGAALFTAPELQKSVLADHSWSLETIGDRLLAYRLPQTTVGNHNAAHSGLSHDQDTQFVAELAKQISAQLSQ